MPSATTTSFDDDFISDRLLTFMHNGDCSGGSNSRASFSGLNTLGLPASAQKTFSLDKDGSLALSNKSNPVTCNSPVQQGANGYAAVSSSHLINKYTAGMINSAFSTPNPGTKVLDDYHSLQNSPFYNHYPMNGFASLKHPNDPLCNNLLSNGNGQRCDTFSNPIDCQMVLPRRPPQRELFPSMPIPRCDNGWPTAISSMNVNANGQPPGLLMQDRLFYNSMAQKRGYIVGAELERIKENSRRSTSHTYGRISAHFRNRYGETEAKTKASYMQLGVRVPSKDHVSEIVGKGGQKIKLIREETGALITTPGEYEDHVFIIEAPPEIALHVAELISTRAQEITQSKMSASERRRGSTSSIPGCMALFSMNSINGSAPSNGRLMNRSPDDLPTGSLPSPAPLLKTNVNSGSDAATFAFSNGLSSGNNVGGSSGRILLARSKISVPQDMVGKIIGTQGSIITTIQKDTGTEIKSPPKEAARGPSATSEFEISAYQSLGMTSNQAAECRVQQAKQLIGHLVMRQFERRASEELDEGGGCSGKPRANSTGDDCDENGSASSRNSKTVGWMWPDVAQMDSTEAREVLDRILAESKSKTRRAKELAAAAAATTTGSVPPSPSAQATGGFGGEFFPPDKVTTSCHNSPFHQARVTMPPPQAPPPPPPGTSQNGYQHSSGPAQVNLLNGFMSERRIPNVEYHTESDFQDLQLLGGGSSTSAFWPNHTPHPLSAARNSFSAGPSGNGNGNISQNSPIMLRRHTMASDLVDNRPDHHQLLLESLAADMVKENSKPVSGTNTTEHAPFDLIQTLDSLCLGSDGPAISGGELSYPPGFDNRGSAGAESSSAWPTSFFSSGGGSDGLSDGSATSDAAIRSIWADTPGTGGSGELFSSFSFTANPLSGIGVTASSSGGVPNRCGAIGEGRRRSTPPAGTAGGPNEAASIPAV
ncbi:unnamed protein product [Mesocestoides corti]|uniref:RNA-binding protein MEX3B n=1 Tax=Mesocestoides corti TaxID=53468 RepID=A0A0R3UGA8_MESCO|nr:unnamed protein product [Mesocestoides corti]